MFRKILFFIPISIAIIVWVFFYIYEKNNVDTTVRYPCVSYAPYDIDQIETYSKEEIKNDLLKIQKISSCVRVYAVTNGLEQVPAIAEELGMEVIVGAWLDENPSKNEEEIANLLYIAKNSNNIKFITVGNETILMKRVTREYLYNTLDMVRKVAQQPVTTTETITVWFENVELEDHVDFIGIHDFPYWRGINIESSLGAMKKTISDAKLWFIKPVTILEIGWPTDGPTQGDAHPGLRAQQKYLRETGNYLEEEGVFYNVADGINVPSKLNTTEGLVGLHWGVLTYEGDYKKMFTLLDLLTFIYIYSGIVSILYRYNRNIILYFKTYIITTELVCILVASAVAYMLLSFYNLYLTVSIFFQVSFTILVVYSTFECVNKYIQLRYSHLARKKLVEAYVPYGGNSLVSILVAAKDETSDQVIKTLNSLIEQSYNNIEILYIDNNSKNRNSFDEISKYYNQNPFPKLKLFYKKNIVGYKAGALNFLLNEIDPKSKFIALVDSDYITYPNWIETSLGYVKPDTGFVQFPQAYNLDSSAYTNKQIIEIGATVEQSFVFDVVYPVRSFMGDVVQNGTMVMIDRKYMANGWPTYSICEDAALGLNISKQGGKSVYVPTVMGKGTAPKTFTALRKQRNRWVFGAIQILQRLVLYPKKTWSKTFALYFIDWLGWIVHGLYPVLLLSSIGFIFFLWLVYLYLQISWVMLVGFVFVAMSLIIFTIQYLQTYKTNSHKYLEIFSLLLIEFGLVNTISKTVLTGLYTYKAKFVTTRQIGDVKVYDLTTLSFVTCLIWVTLFLWYILFIVQIPFETKILGFAQLSVVTIPQLAYAYLRAKY